MGCLRVDGFCAWYFLLCIMFDFDCAGMLVLVLLGCGCFVPRGRWVLLCCWWGV